MTLVSTMMRSILSWINWGKTICHSHHLSLISTFLHWTIPIIVIVWTSIRIVWCTSLTAFSLLCCSSINTLMHLGRSGTCDSFGSIAVSRIPRRQWLIVIVSRMVGTTSSTHVVLNRLQLRPVVNSLDFDGWGQRNLSHFSPWYVLLTVYNGICQLLLVSCWRRSCSWRVA